MSYIILPSIILLYGFNDFGRLTMHELEWTGEVDMVKPTVEAPQAEFIALALTATAKWSQVSNCLGRLEKLSHSIPSRMGKM